MNFKSYLFLFVCNCFFVFHSQAGINDSLTCTQKLLKAEKVYNDGRLAEVEPLVAKCIEDGFTDSERLRALRLLILTSLFNDQPEKADEYMLKLFKEDPEYQLNPAVDPKEFYDLYNSYRTPPIINIGVSLGINNTFMQETKAYIVDPNSNTKARYSSSVGFNAGIVTDILLHKSLQLSTGFIWSMKQYKYEMDMLQDGYTKLTSDESMMFLEIPLAVKYNIGKGKLKPFIYGGGSAALMISDVANMQRTNTDKSNAATVATVDLLSQRQLFNVSLFAGLGARYKVGYGYIFLDARYYFGLNNISNESMRFQPKDSEVLYYYGYVPSDAMLQNLFISIGYMKSFYKPKKIKSKE